MPETPLPNPLFALLGRALEALLNRALNLDEESKLRVAALEGRAIAMEFRGMAMGLRVHVEGAQLRVGPIGDSDLTLRATPASFVAMALRRDETSAWPVGKIEMSGDVDLARRVEQLLSRFDPDFEEALTHAFGDVIGYQIAQTLKRAFNGGRDGVKFFLTDCADYLRDESRDLIAPTEMETFLDDVDTLNERTERLEARVRRILSFAKEPTA